MSRVDVHEWEGEFGWMKRLLCQAKHHDGILPSREKEHGFFKLSGHFAHDENGFGLQRFQVSESVALMHVGVSMF